MPLVYAAVHRGSTLLAEYAAAAAAAGNVPDVAARCLQHALESQDSRLTITCDGHTFNFLRAHGGEWLFVAAADSGFGRAVPFACLERIAEAWERGGFPTRAQRAAAHSFDRAFKPRIKEYVDHFNANPESVDRMAAVQRKVDETRSVMLENVNKVVVRGEKLQALQERTEELQASAAAFKKQGQQLRQEFWWQGAKVKIAIFASVLIILLVIGVVLGCFGGANRCVPKKIV